MPLTLLVSGAAPPSAPLLLPTHMELGGWHTVKRISAFGLRAAMLGATSIIATTAIAEPVLAQEPAEPDPAAAKAAREKAEADYRALSVQIGQRAGDPAFDYPSDHAGKLSR